jgi:hypothetical protein
MTTGAIGVRQRVWNAIRRSSVPFTSSDIAAAIAVETEIVRDYIAGLSAAGFISIVGRSRKGVTYALARDNGVEAPRVNRSGHVVTKGLAQEQMWRVLRMLGRAVTCHELALHASTRDVPVSIDDAARYMEQLTRAGYVIRSVVCRSMSTAIPPAYRLVSNTGPRPPMLVQLTGLFDPNHGRVVWTSPMNEEVAIYGN